MFALMAFVQSAVWLSQIADEVVALFQAIGNIFSVADDLLGATVLAWGETVPDLMAMIAVARAGACPQGLGYMECGMDILGDARFRV